MCADSQDKDGRLIIPPLQPHARPLDALKLDPANANQHPPRSIEAIKNSLAAFGQRQVLVAKKDGTVIAGNGRLLAMRELGWAECAAIFVDDDDLTAVRYAIADNRTTEFAEWDDQALGALLEQIQDEYGTIEDLGFDAPDLPDTDVWTEAFDAVPEGEQSPMRTMTFTIHADQKEAIEDAIKAADSEGLSNNKNGNALFNVCVGYLDGR